MIHKILFHRYFVHQNTLTYPTTLSKSEHSLIRFTSPHQAQTSPHFGVIFTGGDVCIIFTTASSKLPESQSLQKLWEFVLLNMDISWKDKSIIIHDSGKDIVWRPRANYHPVYAPLPPPPQPTQEEHHQQSENNKVREKLRNIIGKVIRGAIRR